MKKIILILIVLISVGASAQQNNQWTPEQQEQFRKQMEQFKLQMQQEMESLRDSLEQMHQVMQNYDWQFDSESFEMPEMPEAPGMPSSPEPRVDGDDMSGVDVNAGDENTTVRVGKWNVIVNEGDDGDHVKVYKSDCGDYSDCCDDDELDNVETRFLFLDIGVNNYFAKGFSSDFPDGYEAFVPNTGKSWVVNIHAIDQRLNLIDHHLWLAYGLYFELNSYKYNSKQVLTPGIDSVAFEAGDETLKKNKLSCEYIGIPLMLRYESNPTDLASSFHISAGGFGEYLIGAHTKTKTTEGDKSKHHDDFNLNPFRYGIVVRAGYGFVSVFAHFTLSELLVDGAGPVLYPFSAGLALEF